MKVKVKFFDENLIDAIGTGIYEIYVKSKNEEKLFYIGESVFVLVRCATHLYEIAKGKGYLGFTEEKLDDENITLIFKLVDTESDKIERKKKEKELIKQKRPIMQSGISDRVKSIEDMIDEFTRFLNKE